MIIRLLFPLKNPAKLETLSAVSLPVCGYGWGMLLLLRFSLVSSCIISPGSFLSLLCFFRRTLSGGTLVQIRYDICSSSLCAKRFVVIGLHVGCPPFDTFVQWAERTFIVSKGGFISYSPRKLSPNPRHSRGLLQQKAPFEKSIFFSKGRQSRLVYAENIPHFAFTMRKLGLKNSFVMVGSFFIAQSFGRGSQTSPIINPAFAMVVRISPIGRWYFTTSSTNQ